MRVDQCATAPILASVLLLFGAAASASGQTSFVNWETPHIHPLDITPDGTRLLAVNTADNRLEVFDVSGGTPMSLGAIPVGLDPVTVRARTNDEIWVINHISDSISIVSLAAMNVVQTINVGDEPCDVVFAGVPSRAFVSISQENRIAILDPANLATAQGSITIEGEDPRSLATDGVRVYVAVFESGNGTTIISQPIVSSAVNPYPGDQNPPPNAGGSFSPPINAALSTPPAVGMIVKKDAGGVWRDDNGFDWSAAVTWDVHDHDVAIIDANTQAVTYKTGLMNLNMSLSVRPDGMVSVIGTEAINQIRYEPVISGIFVRVMMASFDPVSPGSPSIVDLNGHLDYTTNSIPINDRFQSIGDPRAIVWNSSGLKGYVAGMGSDNIAIIDAFGARLGRIDVAQGPTGLVLDEANNTLYALNKFDGLLTVIDTLNDTVALEVPFYDPTPAVIKNGRPFLYNTQQFSGLGQLSCGSCHIDGRMDQLAWDLGNPTGAMKTFNQSCVIPGNLLGCSDWHPMKGPMTTQTLVGIVGTEPFHWRGDKENLAAFNPAFVGLMGGDTQITQPEMQMFNAFVATLAFPPNPFRNFDGTTQNAMVNGGNPSLGEDMFFNVPLDGGFTCNSCHTAPSGTNFTLTPGGALQETQDVKVPQLRNMYEKTGFDKASLTNNRGFAFVKDGAIDGLFDFLLFPAFAFSAGEPGNQERRNVAAFLFSFSDETHSGVGTQTTLIDELTANPSQVLLISDMIALADTNTVGLIVKGLFAGEQRGFTYLGLGQFQSDRANQVVSAGALQSAAAMGSELTYTIVPNGSEVRIGIDRDEDGAFDRDELDAGSNPADPTSVPIDILPLCAGDADGSGAVDFADITSVLANWLTDYSAAPSGTGIGDANADSVVNFGDITSVLANWLVVCP